MSKENSFSIDSNASFNNSFNNQKKNDNIMKVQIDQTITTKNEIRGNLNNIINELKDIKNQEKISIRNNILPINSMIHENIKMSLNSTSELIEPLNESMAKYQKILNILPNAKNDKEYINDKTLLDKENLLINTLNEMHDSNIELILLEKKGEFRRLKKDYANDEKMLGIVTKEIRKYKLETLDNLMNIGRNIINIISNENKDLEKYINNEQKQIQQTQPIPKKNVVDKPQYIIDAEKEIEGILEMPTEQLIIVRDKYANKLHIHPGGLGKFLTIDDKEKERLFSSNFMYNIWKQAVEELKSRDGVQEEEKIQI